MLQRRDFLLGLLAGVWARVRYCQVEADGRF